MCMSVEMLFPESESLGEVVAALQATAAILQITTTLKGTSK